jgi:hypothetical protein
MVLYGPDRPCTSAAGDWIKSVLVRCKAADVVICHRECFVYAMSSGVGVHLVLASANMARTKAAPEEILDSELITPGC